MNFRPIKYFVLLVILAGGYYYFKKAPLQQPTTKPASYKVKTRELAQERQVVLRSSREVTEEKEVVPPPSSGLTRGLSGLEISDLTSEEILFLAEKTIKEMDQEEMKEEYE